MKSILSHNISVLLILAGLSSLIYLNSLNNGFYYDDANHILKNTNIRSLKNIPLFFIDMDTFTAASSKHYRPLVLVTHAINYAIGGLNPIGYHVVNLMFHVGSAFLVFLMLRVMLGGGGGAQSQETLQSGAQNQEILHSQRSFFIALASALIFAVHPFNSEAVNYITARSSVMSGFFYLLAFYCWVKFRKQSQETLHSPYYIASLLAFILGMLSKEVVVTLPVMLMLYDLYFIPVRNLTLNEWVRRRIRLSLPLVPFVLIVILSYLAMKVIHWEGLSSSFKRAPLVQLYTELPVLTKYLRLFILPVGLNIDHYSEVYKTFFVWPVIGSAVVIISFASLAAISCRAKAIEWRVVSFFMVWFFVALLPTTVVSLNAIFQENRGYLAIIVFVVFAGVALGKLAMIPFLSSPRMQLIILGVLLLLYSAGTVSRNNVWGDGVTLWSDALRKSPGSWRAYNNLGTEYAWLGKNEQAIRHFLMALRFMGPDSGGEPGSIHYNLGTAYQQTGRLDMAIKEYMMAAELDPSDFRPYYNLGIIFQQRGEIAAAIEAYKTVLRRDPSHFKSYHNIGLLYQTRGDYNLAEEYYKKAIRLNPEYIRSRFNLGTIYEKGGKLGSAREEYLAVIKSDPDYVQAYYKLGYVYEQVKKLDMAINAYKEAMRRNREDRRLEMHIRGLEDQYNRQR